MPQRGSHPSSPRGASAPFSLRLRLRSALQPSTSPLHMVAAAPSMVATFGSTTSCSSLAGGNTARSSRHSRRSMGRLTHAQQLGQVVERVQLLQLVGTHQALIPCNCIGMPKVTRYDSTCQAVHSNDSLYSLHSHGKSYKWWSGFL